MNKKIIFVLVVVFTTSLSGWGISKIGGLSIFSPNNGFEVDMPSKFADAQQVTEDKIRLVGPYGFNKDLSFGPQLMEVDAFEKSFSTLTSSSRADVENFFVSRNWKKLSFADPCVDAYRIDNPTASSIVATWGHGRGISMVVVNSYDGLEALDQIYASLKVDPNSCGW